MPTTRSSTKGFSVRPSLASLPEELLAHIGSRSDIMPKPKPSSPFDLPPELLNHVKYFLDLPSRSSLDATLSSPTEYAIWSSLHLTVNPNFGRLPLVEPFDEYSTRRHAWLDGELVKAEAAYAARFKEKMAGMEQCGSTRTFEMVKAVKAVPHPAAIADIGRILLRVSPTLQSLDLCGLDSNLVQRRDNADTIDAHFREYPAGSFLFLTHLRIENLSLRFAETLLTLCIAAPNLESLDADVYETSDRFVRELWEYERLRPANFTTAIRRLRLAWRHRYHVHGDETYHPCIQIISSSPQLRQVSMEYDDNEDALESLVGVLGDLQYLQDLHLPIDSHVFRHHVRFGKGDWTCFRSLSRLALQSNYDVDMFDALPEVLALEMYYTTCLDFRAHTQPTIPLGSYPPPRMSDDLASSLRNSPIRVLHTVRGETWTPGLGVFDQLDAIEAEGRFTGTVSSYRHGDEEILHVRLFTHHFEIADIIEESDREAVRKAAAVVNYYSVEGDCEREKLYEFQKQGAWQDITDLGGVAVPLAVLERMRIVEGESEADWQGRGIQVSTAGWQVVEEWRGKAGEAME